MLEAWREKLMEKSSGFMNNTKQMLQALGYDNKQKLLIIHADDAGLSHSENQATMEALRRGLINSYSIMVPCPWFYEIAEFALQYPNFDHGIHLTLSCEWNSYKFGPVLSQEEVPSLVDAQGYFFKSRKEVLNRAKPEEVKKELCAQIERALSFGLRPTHLDSHMYTLGTSIEFLNLYREIGNFYQLPIMLNSKLITEVSGIKTVEFDLKNELVIDSLYLGNLTDFKKGKLADYYANALKKLQPGINMILIHPAYDTHEMRAITKNHPNFGSAWRQIDLEFFTSQQCEDLIKKEKIQMISWTEIKKLIYP